MRAVSLPSSHAARPVFWIVALVGLLILGSALLVFAVGPLSGALDPLPDGQLLGPFRWRPEAVPVA